MTRYIETTDVRALAAALHLLVDRLDRLDVDELPAPVWVSVDVQVCAHASSPAAPARCAAVDMVTTALGGKIDDDPRAADTYRSDALLGGLVDVSVYTQRADQEVTAQP